MSAKIVTITNPVELLLAQLHEIRTGNADTLKEIERLTKLLRGGQKAEAQLEAELNELLAKHKCDEGRNHER
jgi:hypothetical protein